MYPNAVWQTFAAAITEQPGHNYRGMCRYNRILLPRLNTLPPLFLSDTPKPSFPTRAWPQNQPPERNKCSCLRGHRSADVTEVPPDRTPLVGRQPLIGQWWCHHPEECVKGLSCSGDRGFVSFPCCDPVTSSPFSSYIYVQPQARVLTSESLRYECV